MYGPVQEMLAAAVCASQASRPPPPCRGTTRGAGSRLTRGGRLAGDPAPGGEGALGARLGHDSGRTSKSWSAQVMGTKRQSHSRKCSYSGGQLRRGRQVPRGAESELLAVGE